MAHEKGSLTIHSENIMPIIKKWLYSDTDIFLRELVSNAVDAVSKHQRLVNLGEAELGGDEKYRVDIRLDKEARTIVVSDNGIGMTADEIKKYINQIAFSGASDFIEKYKIGEGDAKANDIIGHFGLGFYSAFMVASRVQIDTLSYQEGAEAARWSSDGTTEFELSDGERASRGTDITLFVSEDSGDFLDAFKLRETLHKYCGYLPVEIFFTEAGKKEPEHKHDHEHGEDCDHEHGGEKDEEEKEEPINDTNPLWLKKPADCSDDDYRGFYRKAFFDFNEPLFWIHLNLDHPFRLRGILYFPKLKHELESIEGQVKLFNNQVFIAENIKEVIPEFLLLLKGVIDCPDLPLNVSRSFLQNDGYVASMSKYITRKVADKLNSVFSEDREGYNKNWEDINQFIKYGCIKDKDFYEKVKGSLVYRNLSGEYLTKDEYLERNKDKVKDKIFYVTNEQQQSQYIKLFKDEGIEAVVLSTRLDAPFMSYVESYERGIRFARIDADLNDALKSDDKAGEDVSKALSDLFAKTLNEPKLKIKAEALKSTGVSAVMLLSEEGRRMKEMSAMFGGMNADMYAEEETLVLNTSNPLAKKLLELKDDPSRADDLRLACEHVYDLAMLSHKPLSVEAMTAFVQRSNEIVGRVLG